MAINSPKKRRIEEKRVKTEVAPTEQDKVRQQQSGRERNAEITTEDQEPEEEA